MNPSIHRSIIRYFILGMPSIKRYRGDVALVDLVVPGGLDVLDLALDVPERGQGDVVHHTRPPPPLKLRLAEVLVRHKLQPIDALVLAESAEGRTTTI